MWTTIWLTVTTLIGYGIGDYYFLVDNVYAGWIGAGIGFGIGGFIRLMIAAGGEGIEGIFEIIGGVIGAILD